ncbi:MAG: hypothetical protein H6585_00155 [Flavobacteriales bacterium]|nr:hypothetical protein [Flavobacteriales bacterium]MCB9446736.1 hypothetical protein [Flavobacteriales bacterium]
MAHISKHVFRFLLMVLFGCCILPAQAGIGATYDLRQQRNELLRKMDGQSDCDSIRSLQAQLSVNEDALLKSMEETLGQERELSRNRQLLLNQQRWISLACVLLMLIALAIQLITHTRMRQKEQPMVFYRRLWSDAGNFFLHPAKLASAHKLSLSDVLIIVSIAGMLISLALHLGHLY